MVSSLQCQSWGQAGTLCWLWSREAWELGQDLLTALVHTDLASAAGSASLSPVSVSENNKTRISHLTRLLGESNDTVNVKELHKL